MHSLSTLLLNSKTFYTQNHSKITTNKNGIQECEGTWHVKVEVDFKRHRFHEFFYMENFLHVKVITDLDGFQ